VKRIVALSLATLLAVLACEDRPEDQKAVTAPTMQKVLATDSSAGLDSNSTICRAYSTELAVAKASQVQYPQDDKLRAKITTLNAVIADACH
jgi:hypothetical protein